MASHVILSEIAPRADRIFIERVGRNRSPQFPLAVAHGGFNADFDAVYSQFRAQIDSDPETPGVSRENLVPLIMACIRLAEDVSKRSKDKGPAKRELVMAIVSRLIADAPLNISERTVLLAIFESVGPSIIDGLIAADHGKLLAGWWRKLKASCSCCCKK